MRKLFILNITLALVALLSVLFVGPARAADYPAYTPPEPTEAWSWTGWYIGGVLGWNFGDNAEYVAPLLPEVKIQHDLEGLAAGAVVGGYYQSGMFVGGLNVTGLWLDVNGEEDIPDYYLETDTTIDTLILAKAQAGVAMERWYVYATGGYAGASVNPSGNLAQEIKWDDSQWADGWVWGAGVNWAMTENIILGVEYNHVTLHDVNFSALPTGMEESYEVLKVNGDYDLDLVLGTVSIKF